ARHWERLEEALRAAAGEEPFLHPAVAKKVAHDSARLSNRKITIPAALEPLSERELEILRLIARGASNREIADALFLAEGTVKNYVTNILGKLEVRDRTQAALKARENNLV